MKTNHCCAVSLAAWLLGMVAAPAQPPANPAQETPRAVVELPPFTVTGTRDLPPPESWQYARIDGFEVLSNASEYDTNRLLRDFQRFRAVLQIIRPASAPPPIPSSLILCDRQNKFRDFVPGDRGDNTGLVSLFLRNREQAAIVLDLERTALYPADFAVLLPGSARSDELEVDHVRLLHREYVRFLLSEPGSPPPPWLLEGFTGIVLDTEFTDRWINLGKLDITIGLPSAQAASDSENLGDVNQLPPGWAHFTGNSLALELGGVPPDEPVPVFDSRQFNMVLRRRELIPMDKLFAVTADAPEARNPLGNSLWAKQAYAFVHMCIFQADGKYRKPYATFVQRLAHEPLSETLFQECFQKSYQGMLAELQSYIRYPRHVYRHIELTKEGRITATDATLREATPGEVGRIKGDAQRLADRHADALLTYRAAYARGERDPGLLAALGVEEQHAGQPDRARKFLEAAAKLGTDRPSAYLALARLRLDEARQKPAAENGKLAAAQVAAVLAPLLKARTLKPALPETYEVMAETWALSAVPPTVANVHVLGEGVMQFPSNSDLTYRTAQLYAQAGDPRNAAELARLGLRFAVDSATRSRFEAFLATLPPPQPAPASADSVPTNPTK